MTLAEQSILDSVKKVIGMDPSYTAFDEDVIMHINTAFSKLFQLGVGPKEFPFAIESNADTWGSFLGSRTHINMVKTFVCMSVRLIFDPPPTSFGIAAVQTELKEMEWRLKIMDDTTHQNYDPYVL
mgnify:CR=1 FL=1